MFLQARAYSRYRENEIVAILLGVVLPKLDDSRYDVPHTSPSLRYIADGVISLKQRMSMGCE